MSRKSKRTELDTWTEVQESMAHVNEVSARIGRLLAEQTAPRPQPDQELADR
jgi:hypothetical protein